MINQEGGDDDYGWEMLNGRPLLCASTATSIYSGRALPGVLRIATLAFSLIPTCAQLVTMRLVTEVASFSNPVWGCVAAGRSQ